MRVARRREAVTGKSRCKRLCMSTLFTVYQEEIAFPCEVCGVCNGPDPSPAASILEVLDDDSSIMHTISFSPGQET